MKSIFTRHVVAAGAVLMLLGAPGAFAASTCVTGKDEAALQTRLVQTDLMVAALTCKKNPQYNAFVTRHQKELMKTHQTLRGFFKKRGGEEALNEFFTRLANDSSKRSIANVKAFCENATIMYEGALGAEVSSFTNFAVVQPVSKLHGFVACTPTQEASTRPNKPEASNKRVPMPVRKPAALASVTESETTDQSAGPVLISR
jgi:hypothetical protein